MREGRKGTQVLPEGGVLMPLILAIVGVVAFVFSIWSLMDLMSDVPLKDWMVNRFLDRLFGVEKGAG